MTDSLRSPDLSPGHGARAAQARGPCWNARLPSWKHHDAPARLHFRLTSFVLKIERRV